YIIDHRDIDWESVLRAWSWLLPTTVTVWIMNRFGDLFVVLDDGTIHMLDVGGGTLKKVADSRDDFANKLDEDDNANQLLMIPLIDQLVTSGLTLREGQCYSYKQPPVLGGAYTVENTCVLPIQKHYGAYASIHSQIKDLPDGMQVVINVKK
ncbi:MAG TPA: T6SS immunity protein Tdi1 domain-containing protein, partial [Humisphaera sp.]|nr:T6SS immunity protein Tdi1 domain-containing protein [Humisphaera sp.]